MAEPAFLLDSNVCIYILDDAASLAALRVQECAPGSVVTSAIVYAEVVRGVAPERDGLAKLDALFDVIPVLPFDAPAALAYARLSFRRGTFDRLIGAHALSLGLTLVTNDERDFAGMPQLRIENWTRE